jgi:hypothetical protein
MPDTNAPRTIAVILGASTFPDSPTLAGGKAFYLSADDVKRYLREDLAVPEQSILWLFDDSRSPSDQLRGIGNFLERHTRETSGDAGPENLLIYYVGHGLFTPREQAYCLAIRYTTSRDEGATSIRAGDLAGTVKNYASFLRRYLIFDCCFSASINKEFQSGALHAARTKLASEFPGRGTALLCSSNSSDASLAPQGLDHTMFSLALIEALKNGHRELSDRFSFSELGDLVKETLKRKFPEDWVRPEIHTPDQREGNIADIPMFPNPAYRVRETVHRKPQPERELETAEAPPAREKVQPDSVRKPKAKRPTSPSPAVASASPITAVPLTPTWPAAPPSLPRDAEGRPAASMDAAVEHKLYRASLSRFRRWLLLYKPPRSGAWIPRLMFYWILVSLPYIATRTDGATLLGAIIMIWAFRALSVWMETPRRARKTT